MPHYSDDIRERDDAPITASKTTEPARQLLAESVTINRSADELYDFWRQPTNLVPILENIASIEPLDDLRSRWTLKSPADGDVSWVTRITEDLPGQSITWQSEDGADVANSGRIEFIPAEHRGTIVRAVIAYDPPGGSIGAWFAKLFRREPRIQTRRDLHRFKQFMETGEIATGARNRRIHDERKGD